MTLSQHEADQLVALLKEALSNKRLHFPASKGKMELEARAVVSDERFMVTAVRGDIVRNKCSYQGRCKDTNVILLRLDVNSRARHINPDGTKIIGTHLHLYKEGFEIAYAIPFEPKDPCLFQTCLEFFDRFHLIRPEGLYSQTVIEERQNDDGNQGAAE